MTEPKVSSDVEPVRDAAMALIVRSRLSLATEVITLRRKLAALNPIPVSSDVERVQEARQWLASRTRWDGHENRLHHVLSALDAALNPIRISGGDEVTEAMIEAGDASLVDGEEIDFRAIWTAMRAAQSEQGEPE